MRIVLGAIGAVGAAAILVLGGLAFVAAVCIVAAPILIVIWAILSVIFGG